MEEKGLITVGIPVIKSCFLRKSINKALEQSYPKFEILVLNNAENKITRNEIKCIVNEYSDIRIKYLENKKQIPMIKNWNLLLDHSLGEFFTILCDDDLWEPDFLQEMYNLTLDFPETNLFHSRTSYIDGNDETISLGPNCPKYEDVLDFIYYRLKGYRKFFLSDFMTRTDILKKIGGFVDLPSGWGSDDLTWFKIASYGGVVCSNKILFKYRISEINISNKSKVSSRINALNIQKKLILEIVNNYDEDVFLKEIKKARIQNEIDKLLSIKKILLLNKLIRKKYKMTNLLSLPISFLVIKIFYNGS